MELKIGQIKKIHGKKIKCIEQINDNWHCDKCVAYRVDPVCSILSCHSVSRKDNKSVIFVQA